MTPFLKLDCKITDKSIWREDSDTRIVWITMLTMADSSGVVEAAITGIASRANVCIEMTENAINKFCNVDKYSTNSANNGKRVERVDGGFKILNYEHYRQKDYSAAERQRRHRTVSRVTNVTSLDSYVYDYIYSFDLFWKEYPKKVNKEYSKKLWLKLKPNKELFGKIIYALEGQKKTWDNPQYIPHPSTWLNGKRWEDDLAALHKPKTAHQKWCEIGHNPTPIPETTIEERIEHWQGKLDQAKLCSVDRTLDPKVREQFTISIPAYEREIAALTGEGEK